MINVVNEMVRSANSFSRIASLVLIIHVVASKYFPLPPLSNNQTQNDTSVNSTQTNNSTVQNDTANETVSYNNSISNSTMPNQTQSVKDFISLTLLSKSRTIEYLYSSLLTANTNVEKYQIKGNFFDPLLYELNKAGIYFEVPGRTSQLTFTFQDSNCAFPMVCLTAGSRPIVHIEKNSKVSGVCDYSGAAGSIIRHLHLLCNLQNDFQLDSADQQWVRGNLLQADR